MAMDDATKRAMGAYGGDAKGSLADGVHKQNAQSGVILWIVGAVIGGGLTGYGAMEGRSDLQTIGIGIAAFAGIICVYVLAGIIGTGVDMLAQIAGNQAQAIAKKQAASAPAKVDPADQFARKLGKPEL